MKQNVSSWPWRKHGGKTGHCWIQCPKSSLKLTPKRNGSWNRQFRWKTRQRWLHLIWEITKVYRTGRAQGAGNTEMLRRQNGFAACCCMWPSWSEDPRLIFRIAMLNLIMEILQNLNSLCSAGIFKNKRYLQRSEKQQSIILTMLLSTQMARDWESRCIRFRRSCEESRDSRRSNMWRVVQEMGWEGRRFQQTCGHPIDLQWFCDRRRPEKQSGERRWSSGRKRIKRWFSS